MKFIDNIGPAVIPSMQRDIMDGRPSELGAQSGAVVRMGLEAGVPTPVARLYLMPVCCPRSSRPAATCLNNFCGK